VGYLDVLLLFGYNICWVPTLINCWMSFGVGLVGLLSLYFVLWFVVYGLGCYLIAVDFNYLLFIYRCSGVGVYYLFYPLWILYYY